MNVIRFLICSVGVIGVFLCVGGLHAQTVKLEAARVQAIGATATADSFMGKEAVKVIKDPAIKEVDEPTFAKIRGITFKNGVIEVKVLSRLLADAPEYARGFIGVAFHINEDNTKFESIYLRPTNARVDDQLRRNRSIQYYSYPDYKFDRLRKEAAGIYETYADMDLNEWITMRIEVKDKQAKLFLNDSKFPVFVVKDLKHGGNSAGAIALWVDVGTEGYFSDLKIKSE